ncbi:UDP-glucose 4-epimerase GalE [Pseudonocardia hispaniensis]|uniref:UDP-glucose 4-epimerase n=1 Tax=Pseudonocardia hispaniensis TaxID=904933 RepID=A0ABW1J5V8_9PSEU
MTWLLTGGAGYIGGHVLRALRAGGRQVVVLDDLSTGLRERVSGVPLVEASLLDGDDVLAAAMARHGVTGIVHLAAKKAVAESVERPLYYFEQNVTGTVALLRAAVRTGVRHLLYSSTAAVYGASEAGLMTEDHPTVPSSPYGESKLAAEWLVRRTAEAHGMTWTALRYFNVAGAAEATLADRGVSNLLPIVLRNVERGQVTDVFGGDWPTRDGSCVRDYVHVEDLADAHRAAADGLENGLLRAGAFNVGRGTGVSVLEMLAEVERVLDRPVPHRVVGRRPGDPASVVADVSRIASTLGWKARFGLTDIVASAWDAWRPGAVG